MTYIYNLKQQLPMFEVRKNQVLAKNPRLLDRLNDLEVIHRPENIQNKI